MEDAEAGDTDVAPAEPKQQVSKASLPNFAFAALEKFDKDEIKEGIDMLEIERNTIAKKANMGAIAEYQKKEADYLTRCVF
jgi:structural maintenance of chromosome 4